MLTGDAHRRAGGPGGDWELEGEARAEEELDGDGADHGGWELEERAECFGKEWELGWEYSDDVVGSRVENINFTYCYRGLLVNGSCHTDAKG